jgi:hypothetical protein
MIRLHQFAPAWEVPNLSPFCVKVETGQHPLGADRVAAEGA